MLVSFLLEYGLDAIHSATAPNFLEYGNFFLLYAHALRGEITVKEIERYSRNWSKLDANINKCLLLTAIETEVLTKKVLEHGLVFEAVQLRLTRLRFLCELTYLDSKLNIDIQHLWSIEISGLYRLCADYSNEISASWELEKDLVRTWFSEVYMTTYPIQCMRIMEISSIAYFTAPSESDRTRHAGFIKEFVIIEPGCHHPMSDRFAVSIVFVSLVLLNEDFIESVYKLLEDVTIWLCDRYEQGIGLAGVEADELTETKHLIGYQINLAGIPPRRESLLATVLCDLCAFSANDELYSLIVNDLSVSGITPEYWQAPNTVGACRIEDEAVITYPSIEYKEHLDPVSALGFGEHFAHEKDTFQFVKVFGPSAAIALLALLRDRYFPLLWSCIAPNFDGKWSKSTIA